LDYTTCPNFAPSEPIRTSRSREREVPQPFLRANIIIIIS